MLMLNSNEICSSPLSLKMVLEYYGYYIEGETFKIICPFHEDVNPSLIVDLNEGTWYCFGCSLSGNALSFVKRKEKCNDLQACLLLCKIILKGNEFKDSYFKRKDFEQTHSHTSKKFNKEEAEEYRLNSYNYYKNLSKVDWSNIQDEDMKEVLSYMKKRGFKENTLNKHKAKYTYNNSYPLIFPVMQNKVFKGYVCRTINKDIEKKRKYLYNKGFKRANCLVGSYKKNCKYLFVVEGFMDKIKLEQFGLKNVVALFGWKASEYQLKMISKINSQYIISVLDNDEKGNLGSDYLKQKLGNKVIRFQFMNKYKDAGDFDNKKDFIKMLNKTLQQCE